MKINDVKVDFQVTGWVSENPDKTRFGSIGRNILAKLEPAERTLDRVTDVLYNPNENRAAFLLNYYQPKYDRIVNEGLKRAVTDFEVYDDHKDTFIGLKRKDAPSWLFVVRGIEYMAKEGHVIVGATNEKMSPQDSWYTKGPSVEEVLRRASDHDAITIPSHPLSRFGPVAKGILLAIREPSGTRLGLQEEHITKYSHSWDALEAWSLGVSPEQSRRIVELASNLGIPTVSDSDGVLNLAFSSYNLFRTIDFSSPDALRTSIREGLRGENGNSKEEVMNEFKEGLKDKLEHILVNVVQSRRYF